MFTGLVEEIGSITRIEAVSNGSRLTIEADIVIDGLQPGSSVAIDGVCMTAIEIQGNEFVIEVSPETITRSNFSLFQIGTRVNLERPLSASGRLGGHFVQGHVDATTRQTGYLEEGEFARVTYALPEGLAHFLVEKGSVAINGVSLTVASLGPDSFDVQLIPHTLEVTNLTSSHRAETLNLEVDVLGKYVARFLGARLGLQDPVIEAAFGGQGEIIEPGSLIEPAGGGR
jgi:riboflavin synthase